MIKTEHIGVAIFKILKNRKDITQKEILRILEDKGYKKHKIFLYIRYILAVPLPIKNEEWSIPMIKRDIFNTSNNITIRLNEEWEDTDEKSVAILFSKCNPDKY